MLTHEAILDAFEQQDPSGVQTEIADLFDRLSRERGQTEASAMWSRVCHDYDRRHMSEEEYEEQYGPID